MKTEFMKLSEINENKFPYTLDLMDTNEKVRAKLVGLSRSGGLEPITVTQNFGEGNIEKTVKLFDLNNPVLFHHFYQKDSVAFYFRLLLMTWYRTRNRTRSCPGAGTGT